MQIVLPHCTIRSGFLPALSIISTLSMDVGIYKEDVHLSQITSSKTGFEITVFIRTRATAIAVVPTSVEKPAINN